VDETDGEARDSVTFMLATAHPVSTSAATMRVNRLILGQRYHPERPSLETNMRPLLDASRKSRDNDSSDAADRLHIAW